MGTISIWHTHTQFTCPQTWWRALSSPSASAPPSSTISPSDLHPPSERRRLPSTPRPDPGPVHHHHIIKLICSFVSNKSSDSWSAHVITESVSKGSAAQKNRNSFIFLCWSCSCTLNKDVLLQSELHCVARQVLPAFRNFVQEQSAHSLIHSVSGTDHLDNNTLVFSLCILPTVKMWLKHFSFKAVSTHAVWTHRNKSKQTHQSGATKVNTRRRWWDLDWTQGTEHQEFTLISMIFSNLWHPECKACTGVC